MSYQNLKATYSTRIERRHTLRSATKSAACNSVSPEMSSTIFEILGSEEVAGGGGGVEEDAAVEAVARHLERPA